MTAGRSSVGSVINQAWAWSDKSKPELCEQIAEELKAELNLTLSEAYSFLGHWKRKTDNSTGAQPTRNVIRKFILELRGDKRDTKADDCGCPLGYCSGRGFFEAVRRDDSNQCRYIFGCKCQPKQEYPVWDTKTYGNEYKIIWGIHYARLQPNRTND